MAAMLKCQHCSPSTDPVPRPMTVSCINQPLCTESSSGTHTNWSHRSSRRGLVGSIPHTLSSLLVNTSSNFVDECARGSSISNLRHRNLPHQSRYRGLARSTLHTASSSLINTSSHFVDECTRGGGSISHSLINASCSDSVNERTFFFGFTPLPKAHDHRRLLQSTNGRHGLLSGARAAADASVPFVANAEPDSSSAVVSFFMSERMKVVVLVAIAMALCNADRVIMSVAIVEFASMFNWSTSFAGIVQSSFLWGYALSPIIGGALVDRYGGKTVMAFGVALWSLATFLTPLAAKHSLYMLFAVRVLMGIAEGVAMPSMNNMITRWFPRSERATAVGLSMAGFHLGSVIGLVGTPIFMASFGVNMPFFVFGLFGALWLYSWVFWVTTDPQNHPSIGTDELKYIQQGIKLTRNAGSTSDQRGSLPPFRLFFKKLPALAIIVANAMNNWGYFVLLSWMPIYFNKVYGVNLKQAAWFSAVPWAMMAGLGTIAGSCSDLLITSGLSVTRVRKVMQSIGFIGPAIALLGVNVSSGAGTAVVWLTAAVGLSAFSQAGFLVNFQEIAPRYAGVLHGIANTAGTMAAIISTVGTGYFIQWLGSFQAFLTLTAVLYIVCTLFWNICATGERVID